jgi:hypothetical protein
LSLIHNKKNDAPGAIVEEPLCWVEEYPIRWREPKIDLAELAKLRWFEGLSRKELASRYGKSESAIQNYLQEGVIKLILQNRKFCYHKGSEDLSFEIKK